MKFVLLSVIGAIGSAVAMATMSAPIQQEAHVMREIIRVPDAPQSPLYSQAIKVGHTIYVTGVPGIDPKTNKVAGPTIQQQTRQALINCETILRAGGASLQDVVEVQVLLARPGRLRRAQPGIRHFLCDRSTGALGGAARSRSRRNPRVDPAGGSALTRRDFVAGSARLRIRQ